MSGFLNDVRIAFRGMHKRPGPTLIMVATLAIALAANAAVFSLMDAIVLRPLTFESADRLTLVGQFSPDQIVPEGVETVAPANFLDWREAADAFDLMVAVANFSANVTGGELPERVQGFKVTPGYFDALSVTPLQGRVFRSDEEKVGGEKVVMIGHALWSRRHGADPAVVGSTLTVDGEAHTVVGVAPEGFSFPMGAEVWVPLAFDAEEAGERSHGYLTVIGRLAPGRTMEEASVQVAAIHERLRGKYPEALGRDEARVVTLAEGLADAGAGPFLAVWQFSAVLVLLIACVNLVNLLLARGNDRQRELAVRLSLGAPRRRIVRQLMVESVAVGLAGAAASLPLAWLAANQLHGALPASIARYVVGWERIGVNGHVLAFTSGLALLAAIVFGSLPALIASRPELSRVLREGGRGATEGRRRQRGRNALVVAEVAVALALLVASGLSTRTALQLLEGPQGYEPRGLMTVQTSLPEARYPDEESRHRFVREATERAANLPGVTHAATVNVLPASNNNWSRPLEIEGAGYVEPSERPHAQWRSVTADHLETFRLPLLEGRALSDADGPDAASVAVVSRSFAERHWPGQDALGRRFRMGDEETWTSVVGVSGDHIHHWFGSRHRPTVYVSQAQFPTAGLGIVVRVEANPEALRDQMRRLVAAVDPYQPVYQVKTQRHLISDNTIGLRFAAGIMSAFGVIAFVLAVTGVYGLMAYRVSQRTHEIGVRMALGATGRQVLSMTLGHAGRLTGWGVLVGLGLAWALARGMEGAFVGVLEIEPVTFVAFAGILAVTGLVAAFVPARRALRIDPAIALRVE